MKRYWIAAAAALCTLAVVASTAWVQEDADGRRRRGAGDASGRRPRAGMAIRSRGTADPLPDYTRSVPDLTREQRTQIAKVRQATLEKVKQLEKQMNDNIKKLLTAEQVKAMEEAERRVTHRGPDGVILTDEQKKILDDARAQMAKLDDPAAARQILQEAMEKIRASYTEEQKAQAERGTRRRGQDGAGAGTGATGERPARRRGAGAGGAE